MSHLTRGSGLFPYTEAAEQIIIADFEEPLFFPIETRAGFDKDAVRHCIRGACRDKGARFVDVCFVGAETIKGVWLTKQRVSARAA